MEEGKTCPCPCHKSVSLLVVLFGLTFLLGALNIFSSNLVAIIWPILVILAGAKMLFKGFCKCCEKA